MALEAALQKLGAASPASKRGRFGRKSPDARFDEMLEQCAVWERELGCTPDECELVTLRKGDFIAAREGEGDAFVEGDGEDRMLQVLRGSFAGARCQPVADALRICYLEYSPLRLGGDVIFKLLKRVVASQLTR